MAKKIELVIPALRDGSHSAAELALVGGWLFVKTKDGVFTHGRRNCDLTEGWRMNDRVRGAAAKMLGVKLKDIKAAIVNKRVAATKACAARDLRRLRESAARRGYKLVQTK